MTRRRRPPDDPGFDPVFGESAHEFTPEERLSMELYLVNLRRGLQVCPRCGERKRAWSNRLCLSCGGPGGYSEEALLALGEPYASENVTPAESRGIGDTVSDHPHGHPEWTTGESCRECREGR